MPGTDAKGESISLHFHAIVRSLPNSRALAGLFAERASAGVSRIVAAEAEGLSLEHRLMTNEEIVAQFQQIVETLQRIVNATGDLANRVEQIEDRTAEELGLLTGIQGSLRVLVEQIEKQEQDQVELRARLDALDGCGSP